MRLPGFARVKCVCLSAVEPEARSMAACLFLQAYSDWIGTEDVLEAHLGHRHMTSRQKLAIYVGSAGLAAGSTRMFGVRMMLHRCEQHAIKMYADLVATAAPCGGTGGCPCGYPCGLWLPLRRRHRI